MAHDPDTGQHIEPQKSYLDDIEIFDEELGCVVPAWKSLIYHGVKARHLAQMKRADSAGAIKEEAQKGAPPGEPKLAPPLVADADEGDDPIMEKICAALEVLESRLAVFEQRRAEEAECARRAEAALALAEEIAEQAPATLMDALPPAPKQRLLN
jgi:hypothetical protein